MNKKILLVSILVVFMLLAITFASAVNTSTPVKQNESPLFGIRLRRSIKEKAGEVIENIKTKFLGERIFFLPFLWLRIKNNLPLRYRLQEKTADGETCDNEITWGPPTICDPTCRDYDTCSKNCELN